MKMTDFSFLCKWENLKNRQCIKYLFAPLYTVVIPHTALLSHSKLPQGKFLHCDSPTWDCITSLNTWKKSRTYVRIMYADFSSALSTIIPTLLQTKLTQLSVPSYICQWITSFLTDRLQLVRLGKFMSNNHSTKHWCPSGLCSLPTALLPVHQRQHL